MRLGISIALLILYLTYAFRALIPYVEYAFNYEYISEELCINIEDEILDCKGKCFLDNQLLLIVGKQKSNESVPLESKVVVKGTTHLISKEVFLSPFQIEFESQHFFANTRLVYNVSLEVNTPPPQLA